MKKLFVLLFVSLSIFANAQTVTKYYDADWMETSPGKAMYFADFTKIDGGYKCLSYWVVSKKKREESLYADTSMTKPNGLQKVYGKTGALEDSIFFDAGGKVAEAFHFYPNKQLECHYVGTGTGEVKEAYDEAGGKIKNYIYIRVPEPKGGTKGWLEFIKKNSSKDLTSNSDEAKTVTVKLQFFIDVNGNVFKPKVIESSGFKSVDQDAVRLMLSSPEWSPGIYKNKPIKYPVTQDIKYELQPARR